MMTFLLRDFSFFACESLRGTNVAIVLFEHHASRHSEADTMTLSVIASTAISNGISFSSMPNASVSRSDTVALQRLAKRCLNPRYSGDACSFYYSMHIHELQMSLILISSLLC